MNLFVISPYPSECARMLDDRRVVKMTTETAQMLSDSIRVRGGEPFYEKCNPRHPCTMWVSRTRENFLWTIELLFALATEYSYRYGKTHLAFFKGYQPSLNNVNLFPSSTRTDFQNSSMFKDVEVFLAYKRTMIHKWTNYKMKPSWTKRPRPEWFLEEV